MSVDLNVYAVLNIVGAVVLIPLAWLVYRARPEHTENRRLAFFILASGLLAAWAGMLYLATTPRDAYAAAVVAWIPIITLAPAYLRFIATFDTPLARPFRSPAIDRSLLVLIVALHVIGPLWAIRVIQGTVPFGPFLPYRVVWGSTFDWASRAVGVTGVYAAVAVLWAWHRARRGSARRRQLAWYAGAAVTYDVLTVGRNLVLFPIVASSVRSGVAPPEWVTQFALASVGGAQLLLGVMLAYALLHTQMLDIKLKLKRGLSQSTVAAIFVGMFFLVSEGAAVFFTDRTGSTIAGLVAAAMLVVFITPLYRLAERLSDRAMPDVRDTPQYRAERAREIYAAAVESALEDGRITDRERDVLATLAEKFQLKHTEARQIERDIVAGAGGEAT